MPISFDDFINKYKGKHVEAGGSANAKNQCVDLVNAYIDEVLELPKILWTNAQDFPKKAGDKYEYIPHSTGFIPKKGDIVIFTSDDKVGHIGIVTEAIPQMFYSFDQNWPLGATSRIVGHDYTRVLGYLRAKGKGQSMPQTGKVEVDSQVFENLVKNSTEYDKFTSKGYPNVETVEELEKRLNDKEKELKETRNKLDKALTQQAETTPTAAWEEQKRLLEDAHKQEMIALKAQQDQKIDDALIAHNIVIKDQQDEIGRLTLQLTDPKKEFFRRISSRKFLLAAPTAVLNGIVAFVVLFFDFQPDPAALATALTSLNAVVALFIIPEAVTDHKERIIQAKE